ncbi:chromosome transmission fidelity factor [Peziza echinospora]|nr:chromosome transmission fidelity factor [Peziza echinospora]
MGMLIVVIVLRQKKLRLPGRKGGLLRVCCTFCCCSCGNCYTLLLHSLTLVADSEDEEEVIQKKPAEKKTVAEPPKKKEEEIDKSAYFGGKNKITRTAPVKTSKAPVKKTVVQPTKPKIDENFIDDDDEDFGNDIFAAEFKKPTEEDEEPRRKRKQSPPLVDEDAVMVDAEDDDDDDDEDFVVPDEVKKPAKRSTASSTGGGRKRKNLSDSDEEELEVKPAKAAKTATVKKPTAAKKTPAKKKGPEPNHGSEVQKIIDSVPLVRPPTPPPQEEGKKFSFRDFKQKERGPPPAAGTKELPTGAENCLAGLTFVFTGELDTLSREDGQQLIKRYGGKVTGAPSKKTSFVVLGHDAGPSKLRTIEANNLKTINEDGLFYLISTLPANGGDSQAAAAAEAKRAADDKKILELAKEMERTMDPPSKGKEKEKAAATAGKSGATVEKKDGQVIDNRLWTVKYAPSSMSQICGNKAQVDRLQKWLSNWHKNAKVGFKFKGDDGSASFRAVMIYGPPGIGKTTAAHLIARLVGYDVVESNASDTRSKKLMENSLKGVLDNRSLMGYFGADNTKVDVTKQKLVLIMDEVDGMSAGDRGGVGQLAAICKKTSIPIICICNERKLPKMKPFDHVTFDMPFRRPDAQAIRSRIASIAYREGLKLPPNVIDQLVEGTGSDIRQIINMLSTFAVNRTDMTFDQGKSMSKQWEKHVILKPWDIAQKLLGMSMFSPNANKSLNDKIELYFNDHEFSYLMIQENYLKSNPSRSSSFQGRQRNLENLKLFEAASASISDGDLVDAMIHGPQQHWSLMPVHGVFSTVTPSSLVYGGYGGQQFGFTSWLGNNSKYGKLSRYVKEIQSHMRLRASGDRNEIRQSYLPALWSKLGKRLEMDGKEAIPEVIKLMDDYFLTREDYDAILELGVGPMAEGTLNIPTQVKAGFTREYNGMAHPMPFMKATGIAGAVAAAGKVKKEVPDLEEAIEESDDELALADEDASAKEVAEEEDLSKDKYAKAKKPNARGKKAAAGGAAKGKAAAKPRAKAAPKAKVKKSDFIDDDDDDEDEESEDVKPKKRAPAKKTAGGASAAAKRKTKN